MQFLTRVVGAWKQPRTRRWIIAGMALLLAVLIAWGSFAMWSAWDRKRPIDASGGLPFIKRVELAVPQFRQNDPKWGKDPLGRTDDTIGGVGCAISSAAMVLKFYGVDTDPQRLNGFLTENEGYTPQGWVYWEKAAEFEPGKVKHVYEDLPSYRLIDTNLLNGNPVIVRLRYESGVTHFVVIAGKDGFDYLTRDPGRGASKGLYPLKEFGSKIEALRFYQKL